MKNEENESADELDTAAETDQNYVKPGEERFESDNVCVGDVVYASTYGSGTGIFLVVEKDGIARDYVRFKGQRIITKDGKALAAGKGKPMSIFPQEKAHIWVEKRIKLAEEQRDRWIASYETIYKIQNEKKKP